MPGLRPKTSKRAAEAATGADTVKTAPIPRVHVLLPAGDGPAPSLSIIGLYWPATGLVTVQGLPDDARSWALSSSARRRPLDASGSARLGRDLRIGTLLALTADDAGPQSLLALLEVVGHGPAHPRRAVHQKDRVSVAHPEQAAG